MITLFDCASEDDSYGRKRMFKPLYEDKRLGRPWRKVVVGRLLYYRRKLLILSTTRFLAEEI